jgi:hypothetical protein
MHRHIRLFGLIAVLIVGSLALSGCGAVEYMFGAGSTDDAGGPADTGEVSEAAPVEQPTDTPAAPAIDPAVAQLLPDAPALPGSGFRSDSAQVVASTGRPQLLEFFAYW